jgi:hypothetical protein
MVKRIVNEVPSDTPSALVTQACESVNYFAHLSPTVAVPHASTTPNSVTADEH